MLTFDNNTRKKISDHFNAYEFRCRCGGNHKIYIQESLLDILEKVRSELGATSCNIYSGYRCPTHDKKVGGSGSGPHTKGGAVDCYFIKNGKRISSKDVALKLEDLGHNKGIGYRCGGSKPETGQTHIDVINRKWYGDESKSMSKSCCSSFYDYFGIEKPEEKHGYSGEFPSLPNRSKKYYYCVYNNKTKKYTFMDKGSEVEKIQRFLNWAIDAGLGVDKCYGLKTKDAVAKFQNVVGIKADGYYGAKTLEKAKEFEK